MLAVDVSFNSNTILSLVSLLVTFAGYAYLAGVKLSRIEVKVDTMWTFQLRRGLSELERNGLGKANSPVELEPHARELMRPLLPRIKEWYESIKGDKLSVLDLAIEIERQFGSQIIDAVCRKIGVHESACLIIAMSLLREVSSADLQVTSTKQNNTSAT